MQRPFPAAIRVEHILAAGRFRTVFTMDDRRARFEVRLPGDLLDSLNAAARVRRVSASEAVRDAIRAYVAATIDAISSEAAPVEGRPQHSSIDQNRRPAADRTEVYAPS